MDNEVSRSMMRSTSWQCNWPYQMVCSILWRFTQCRSPARILQKRMCMHAYTFIVTHDYGIGFARCIAIMWIRQYPLRFQNAYASSAHNHSDVGLWNWPQPETQDTCGNSIMHDVLVNTCGLNKPATPYVLAHSNACATGMV